MIRLRAIRSRSVAFVAAGWLLGATTSVGVGLLALTLVGEDLRGNASRPLTADAAIVVEQPAAPGPATSGPGAPGATAPEPTATATGSPTPAGSDTAPVQTGEDRRLNSAGGDVVARCTTAGAYLVYWTPAQGFRTDHVTRGPAPTATLTFEGSHTEIKLTITCAGTVPQLNDGQDDD